MLINLRNALMAGKRLPYDAEVEYLENTVVNYANYETIAFPYIDTGIPAADDVGVRITYEYRYLAASRSAMVCGSFVASGSGYFGVYNYGTYNYKMWGGATKMSTQIHVGEVLTTSLNFMESGTYEDILNGATINSGSLSGSPTFNPGSIWAFAINKGNYSVYEIARLRIYGLKITKGSTLVRDYIPVRKGTVGYLYDRVSGKLFGNAGTGDFVLGPDVVPVEYIESHGTEYIDVGPIVGADEVIVKLSASSIPSSGSYKAFGVGYTSNFGDDFGINSSGWCGQSYAPVSLDTQSTAKMNQSGRFIDSKNLGGSSSPFFTKVTAGNRLFLFCGTNGSSAYIRGSGNYMAWRGRFYSCVVSSSGNKMFNHLPIRVGTDATSWEGAMMDTLTRRIYRNAGTGAFTYGNDLKYPIPAE